MAFWSPGDAALSRQQDLNTSRSKAGLALPQDCEWEEQVSQTLQFLWGLCRIIDVDLTLKEDKILFQGAQKLLLAMQVFGGLSNLRATVCTMYSFLLGPLEGAPILERLPPVNAQRIPSPHSNLGLRFGMLITMGEAFEKRESSVRECEACIMFPGCGLCHERHVRQPSRDRPLERIHKFCPRLPTLCYPAS